MKVVAAIIIAYAGMFTLALNNRELMAVFFFAATYSAGIIFAIKDYLNRSE